jgi:hypothetical protein
VSSVVEIILRITRDTAYKDLQKKTYPALYLKQYTPPAQIKQTPYTQPRVTYIQITKHNSYAPTNIEQEPHINRPFRQTSDVQDLKNMMKAFWANGSYAKPLHNRD